MGFFQLSVLVSEKPVVGSRPKCGACQLYKSCKTPKLEALKQGTGRDLLIIGPPPSQTEDSRGKWLTGESGTFLRRLLKNLRIKNWTYTGCTICHNTIGKKKAKNSIEWCRPTVLNLIKELKPKAIVTLGLDATESVLRQIWKHTNFGNLSRWTGWTIPCFEYSSWVIPTFSQHEAVEEKAVLVRKFLAKHFMQAKKAMKRQSKIKKVKALFAKKEKNIKLLYGRNEIKKWLAYFAKQPIIAFDYEATSGKPEYKGAEIVCVSISNGDNTVAFPMTHRIKKPFFKLLRNKKVKKIASNMKYEDRMTTYFFGKRVRNWAFDTMLGAHVQDCRRGITGLKFQMFGRFGIAGYNKAVEAFLSPDEEGKGKINKIRETVEMSQLLEYCAKDSLYEFLLAKQQTKQMGFYNQVFGDS